MSNPTSYSEEELQALYDYVAVSVASEMLLATGFIILVGVALAVSLGWKKTSLILLLGFGAVTFFIPSGYTLYASPLIAAIAFAGLAYSLFLKAPEAAENAN